MTRPIKFLSGSVCLAVVAMLAATGLTSRQAQAQVCCSGPPPNDVTDYAVLYQGDPHNLNFTNSTVVGNIGIGDDGSFVGTPPGTVTGTVRFFGPDNSGGPSRFR